MFRLGLGSFSGMFNEAIEVLAYRLSGHGTVDFKPTVAVRRDATVGVRGICLSSAHVANVHLCSNNVKGSGQKEKPRTE